MYNARETAAKRIVQNKIICYYGVNCFTIISSNSQLLLRNFHIIKREENN